MFDVYSETESNDTICCVSSGALKSGYHEFSIKVLHCDVYKQGICKPLCITFEVNMYPLTALQSVSYLLALQHGVKHFILSLCQRLESLERNKSRTLQLTMKESFEPMHLDREPFLETNCCPTHCIMRRITRMVKHDVLPI